MCFKVVFYGVSCVLFMCRYMYVIFVLFDSGDIVFVIFCSLVLIINILYSTRKRFSRIVRVSFAFSCV